MVTKEDKRIKFLECWNDLDDLRKMIYLHNVYIDKNGIDYKHIYRNDGSFFKENYHNDPMEAVRAAQYGHYNFTDKYVWLNGCGNFSSGSNDYDMPFDIYNLADWYCEHYNLIECCPFSEMEKFVGFCKENNDEDENI